MPYCVGDYGVIRMSAVNFDILMIDNFDSFTYNLVDEFEKRQCKVNVYRNNIGMQDVRKITRSRNIHLIVISPGPSSPKDAGISMELIRKYAGRIPIFGVCLGHQCIIESFNGVVDKAPSPCHGKPSAIMHDGKTIFRNLENPMRVGRYHSLCGVEIPPELEVSAKASGSIVMGVRHRKHFVEGVQFHPESILTPAGGLLIENLLGLLHQLKNSRNLFNSK